MKVYYIDGPVDYFETNQDYPDLENAYVIDAGDGAKECFTQYNDIENQTNGLGVIITNMLNLIIDSDEIYIYNSETKTFKKWEDINFTFIDKTSRMSTYLLNI